MKENKYIVFAAMGFELVGLILGCFFLGSWVDDVFHLRGFGIVLFSMLGLAGWIYHVVLLAKQIEKNQDDNS